MRDADRRFVWFDMSCTRNTHDFLAWSSTKMGHKIARKELVEAYFILTDIDFMPSRSIIAPGKNDAFNFEQSSLHKYLVCVGRIDPSLGHFFGDHSKCHFLNELQRLLYSSSQFLCRWSTWTVRRKISSNWRRSRAKRPCNTYKRWRFSHRWLDLWMQVPKLYAECTIFSAIWQIQKRRTRQRRHWRGPYQALPNEKDIILIVEGRRWTIIKLLEEYTFNC